VSEARTLVRNAADPDQVKRAGRKVDDIATQRRNRLRAVMETPEGRAFLWDLLNELKVYESVWHPSALIHYNAGVQDAGHKLMARMVDASEDHYDLMTREARARGRRFDSEVDASFIATHEGDGK